MSNPMSKSTACVLVLAGVLGAQDSGATHFASPQRLDAGEKRLGEDRYFPSPVFHDVDGDGLPDLVVGDLIGRLTVALRLPGKERHYGPEKPLLGADGKEIRFHNW